MEYSSEYISRLIKLGMRKSFGMVIDELLSQYDDAIVLAADVMSSSNLNEAAMKFPNQVFNIGIAEQNMTAIAAGMAKEGRNVFVVSFAPFVSLRNYEAIRSIVSYMNLNVKIVALSSGVSLGVQGPSHFCIEDIAMMNAIPNMKILSPCDCLEMAKMIEYLLESEGPAYLRLTGIDGTPGLHKEDYCFNYNQVETIREGADVAIVSTGAVIHEAVRASRALLKDGISCAVLNLSVLKPIDEKNTISVLNKYKKIYVLEEHNVRGGLGTILSDVFIKNNCDVPVIKIGFDDTFPRANDYSRILQDNGMSAKEVYNLIKLTI